MTPFAFRRERSPDPHERIWLLDDGGEVVGGCRTTPAGEDDGDLGPRAAEVHHLGIAPGRRGAGLGHRLLGHAVNDLLVRSHAPVYAYADAGDAATIAFFGRHGFVPDGRRRAGAVRLVRQP